MSANIDRIRAALRRGERDSRLLDGRGYDTQYWRSAQRALSVLERDLDKARSQRDAFAAVVDGVAGDAE